MLFVAVMLVIGVGLLMSLAMFKPVPCSDLIEQPVNSPDGRWAVLATTKSCPAGPLSVTNYSVTVTLAARAGIGTSEGGAVLLFQEEDAAEPPQVTWTSANELTLKLAGEGTVRTGKHEVGHVSIKYVVPKWLWDRSGEAEDYRGERDKEDGELYKAGKSTKDDLRISLKINQDVAQQWENFRKWVAENAAVEPTVGKSPQ